MPGPEGRAHLSVQGAQSLQHTGRGRAVGANSGSRTDPHFRDSPYAHFTGCSRGVGATVQPKAPTQRLFSQDPTCSLGVVILPGEDYTRLGGGCSSQKGLLASGCPEQGGECARDPVRERECERARGGVGRAGHLTSGLSSGQVRAEGGKDKPQLLKASPCLAKSSLRTTDKDRSHPHEDRPLGTPRGGPRGTVLGISARDGPDLPPRAAPPAGRGSPSPAGETLPQTGSGVRPNAVPTAVSSNGSLGAREQGPRRKTAGSGETVAT